MYNLYQGYRRREGVTTTAELMFQLHLQLWASVVPCHISYGRQDPCILHDNCCDCVDHIAETGSTAHVVTAISLSVIWRTLSLQPMTCMIDCVRHMVGTMSTPDVVTPINPFPHKKDTISMSDSVTAILCLPYSGHYLYSSCCDCYISVRCMADTIPTAHDVYD